MAIVRLWAVLGAGGVRKSTTVGHLAGDFGPGPTGLRRGRGGGLREVPLRGGGYLTIHPRKDSRFRKQEKRLKNLSGSSPLKWRESIIKRPFVPLISMFCWLYELTKLTTCRRRKIIFRTF